MIYIIIQNMKNNKKTIWLIIRNVCIGSFKDILWVGTFYLSQITLISLIVILTIITYVFINYNILITNTLESILFSITSFLFTLSLTLFYLNGFELSNTKLFNYIQIFTFISTSFIIILLAHNHISIDIINCLKDNDNNIHLHGHVSVDKETGKTIGQGMNQGLSTIGSQIGLSGTMIGIGGAVSKAIAKSGIRFRTLIYKWCK